MIHQQQIQRISKKLSYKEFQLNYLPKKSYPKKSTGHLRRKDILTLEEKKLAIRNALRYFPKKWHEELSKEFADELKKYGRIYMYRFQTRL